MNCPYCSRPMEAGSVHFDGRSGIRWEKDGASPSLGEAFWGVGKLTAARNGFFSGGMMSGHFCPSCKKLIIDTDVKK